MLRQIWRVLARPSNSKVPNPHWYQWATNQCGHCLVGACGAALIPADYSEAQSAAMVVSVYAVGKEIPDCYIRGGRARDCIVDAAFVAIGATYSGPFWWPWVILVSVGLGVMAKIKANG